MRCIRAASVLCIVQALAITSAAADEASLPSDPNKAVDVFLRAAPATTTDGQQAFFRWKPAIVVRAFAEGDDAQYAKFVAEQLAEVARVTPLDISVTDEIEFNFPVLFVRDLSDVDRWASLWVKGEDDRKTLHELVLEWQALHSEKERFCFVQGFKANADDANAIIVVLTEGYSPAKVRLCFLNVMIRSVGVFGPYVEGLPAVMGGQEPPGSPEFEPWDLLLISFLYGSGIKYGDLVANVEPRLRAQAPQLLQQFKARLEQ